MAFAVPAEVAQKFARARDLGRLENLSRRALLDDAALVEDDDPVGDAAGEIHLVRDDEHGHAFVGERLHDAQYLADRLRIERRGRLVEEHQRRLHGERAGDRDALLLAAGERGRVDLALSARPHFLEQRVGALLARLRVELQHRARPDR